MEIGDTYRSITDNSGVGFCVYFYQISYGNFCRRVYLCTFFKKKLTRASANSITRQFPSDNLIRCSLLLTEKFDLNIWQ